MRYVYRVFLDIFLKEPNQIFFTVPEEYLDRTEHYHRQIENCQLDQVFVVTHYSPECKNIIENFKYRQNKNLWKTIVPYFQHLFDHYCQKTGTMIITGMPMFFLHSWKRGYNQSFLLAKGLSDATDIPFFPLVKKTRWTKHQAELHKDQRIKNLKNAFRLENKFLDSVQNATIVLVDDVISTGSTANEVATILKLAGAKSVIWLFFATEKVVKVGLDKRKK